jgi:hypothetical protein
MIMLDEKQLAKLGGKVTPKVVAVAVTPPDSDTVALLKEMKKFSAGVLSVLQKEDLPEPPDLPPVVNVSNPVTVLPAEIPAYVRKWRFTVTQRDPNAQFRIKEIIAEALE